MMVLFLFSVAVQYNDPDPLRWMAIYGAAAVACVSALRNSLHPAVSATIGVVALAWTVTLAPGVWGQVGFSELFQEFEMASPLIEEAREMGGLLIVAAWMAVLSLVTKKDQ
jgi:Transmembrane family 220, helix